MAEIVTPACGAGGTSGNTDMDKNGPPNSRECFSASVQFKSSSATHAIEHLTGALQVYVDETTYQIVEELGTRQAFGSLTNPGYSTAVMEQGVVSSNPPIVQQNNTMERQDCSVMDMDDSNEFLQQGPSSNNLLVVHQSTADSQAFAAINTEQSTAVMHIQQESAVNEPAIEHRTEQVETVTYQILEQGTLRARNKLIDSNGYTYNIRTHSKAATYWQCSVRPKVNRCKASVVQRGDSFCLGKSGHNHAPKTLLNARTRISARVKQQAVNNPLKSANTIVNEVLLEEFGGSPAPDFVKPASLARNANRARHSLGPRDANNHAFVLDEDHLPVGFLRKDIVKQGRRYLLFATEEQIRLLSKAKSWYIDETNKFCQEPFKKLLTISAFVTVDYDAKQVPLVFALMSGSERKDYRKVIKKILHLLPCGPSVREVTLFFDEVLWAVLRRALPDANIRGCVLYWMKAAWKAIQELKLQIKYQNDNETNLFLRKVMALPFLPEEEIQPMFVRLWVQASTAPLQLFIQYISTAWIYNTTWPPSTWSVFNSAVRTHKDADRCHPSSGKKPMPLYLLVNFLYQEASELTPLQFKPLSEKKLKKMRVTLSSHPAAKFFHHWEEYTNKMKSAAQLLKACSDVTGLISLK